MEKSKSGINKTEKKFVAFCGRFFILTILIIMPIVLMDYISSFFWPHRRSEIERKYPVTVVRHPKPYVMFGGKPNGYFYKNKKLNALGYRGKQPLIPKPQNEFRIFMLGGSTVFRGTPSIAVLLEKEFEKNNQSNVKVYNYGVVSSVSSMELALILFEISELKPDFIIMYNGGNDILEPYGTDPRPGYPFNFIVYENNPLLESDVRTYPTMKLLLYGSNMARYFFPHYFLRQFVPLEQERQKVDFTSAQWRNEIARKYVNNLVKACKISYAFNSKFATFYQPTIFDKNLLSAEEEKKLRLAAYKKDHYIDVRKRILAKISKIPKEFTDLFIDLSDIYDNTPESVFMDVIHTKQEYKIVIAKAMYAYTINNILEAKNKQELNPE